MGQDDVTRIFLKLGDIQESQGKIIQKQEDSDKYLKEVVKDIADRLDRHDIQLLTVGKIDDRVCQLEQDVKSIPEIKIWQIEANSLLEYMGEIKKWQTDHESIINDMQSNKNTKKDYKKVAITAIITLLIAKSPEITKWVVTTFAGGKQ